MWRADATYCPSGWTAPRLDVHFFGPLRCTARERPIRSGLGTFPTVEGVVID
jgi:hypothetical protein